MRADRRRTIAGVAPFGAAALALLAPLVLLAACGDGESPSRVEGQAVYGAPPASSAGAPPGHAGAGTSGAGAAAVAAPNASAAPRIGAGTLEYPDDVQLILLAQFLAGGDTAATIARWAEDADVVRSANEFERDAALAAETRRLEAILASAKDAGRLRLLTTTQLGEYDARTGVWYLSALQPGTAFAFEYRRASASLALANARDAYRWAMDAATAESTRRRTQYRTVELDAELAITGARMRSGGPQIDARVLGYTLRASGVGEFARVTLP